MKKRRWTHSSKTAPVLIRERNGTATNSRQYLQMDQELLWRALHDRRWWRCTGTCSSVTEGKALQRCSRLCAGPIIVHMTAEWHPVMSGNHICKFADDIDLVVPAVNSRTRIDEISPHIEVWAWKTILSWTGRGLRNLGYFQCARKSACSQSTQ